MQKFNILFYNRGEQKNYIPQSDIFVYAEMLKEYTNLPLFFTSFEHGYVDPLKITEEQFQFLYEHITTLDLNFLVGEKACSLFETNIDYIIITYPWFNLALREALLLVKYLKYKNPDLKCIYLSEFPKFYEYALTELYPQEIDAVISGGFRLFAGEDFKDDTILQKLLSYRNLVGKDYNFPIFDTTYLRGERMIEIQISRGCLVTPRCFYCTISEIKGAPLYKIEDALQLITNCVSNGIRYIYFIDGEINFEKKYFEQLLDQIIAKNIVCIWSSYLLTKDLDRSIIKKMYLAGCRHVRVGIETFYLERQKTLSKNLDLQESMGICQILSQEGISVQAHFIYGFQNETQEELRYMMHAIEKYKDVFDLVDFFYLKYRPRVGSYDFSFEKYSLPFIRDNYYRDDGEKLQNYSFGDHSLLDKKTQLFLKFLKMIGKEHAGERDLSTDPRVYFMTQILSKFSV